MSEIAPRIDGTVLGEYLGRHVTVMGTVVGINQLTASCGSLVNISMPPGVNFNR